MARRLALPILVVLVASSACSASGQNAGPGGPNETAGGSGRTPQADAQAVVDALLASGNDIPGRQALIASPAQDVAVTIDGLVRGNPPVTGEIKEFDPLGPSAYTARVNLTVKDPAAPSPQALGRWTIALCYCTPSGRMQVARMSLCDVVVSLGRQPESCK